jgi:hypothetical protein
VIKNDDNDKKIAKIEHQNVQQQKIYHFYDVGGI